jgi:diguanylate cyclase (GGDEF)-like protein/PAS domain S-box-containing protein
MLEDEHYSPPVQISMIDAEVLFDQLADAVYLIDPDTSNIVWGNRKAWESLGLTREDVLDHSVLSLQMDVHGLPQWSEIAQAIRSKSCFRFIGRHRHQHGHEVAVEVNTTHFQLSGREYFLSVARDITNRVAQESDTHNREKQLWFALNEASDGLWDWEVASGTLFFSPQLKRMLGYGPDEMQPVLETWSHNVHPEDRPHVMAALEEHMHGKRSRYEAEYRLRNRNGHYIWVQDRGRVCEFQADGKPARVVGMVQDISNRKHLELLLQEHASNDPLTGLANRREGSTYLQAQIELCQRLNMPLGLAFIDIDYFKAVNDMYGHLTGDRVLQQVASVVKSAVRGSDLACRWGGEEFIVIAPNTTLEKMHLVAEKVRLAVQHALASHTPPVTISLGVAAASGQQLNHTTLMSDADSALYLAKQNGRNRVELATPAQG